MKYKNHENYDMSDMEVWTEKYRPQTLDDVVGQDDIVKRLKRGLKVKGKQHLMFSGGAGTGKTSMSIAYVKNLFGDDWHGNFLELNASDTRGIDVVRKQIKEFASTESIGGAKFKVIFLDEADNLCLDGDTEVIIGKRSEKRIVKIKDVSQNEYIDIPSLDMLSCDIVNDKGKCVVSNDVDMRKVVLENRKEIIASVKHPFFRFNTNNEIVEVKVKDLDLKSKILDFQDSVNLLGCRNVDTLSFTKEVRIKSIKKAGIRKAYNITMLNNKNFFLSNGILTHNTSDAQSALRRTMERYIHSCLFILSCNYSSKIIEPIQSRCAVYRFKGIESDDIKKRLMYICKCEGFVITEDVLDSIVFVAEGDMRKAINTLQSSSLLCDDNKKITVENVYLSCGSVNKENIVDLVKKSLIGDLQGAMELLDYIVIMEGYNSGDILKHMVKVILYDMNVDDKSKVSLIDVVGETEFRISEGANEMIMMKWMIANMIIKGFVMNGVE